MSNGSESQDKKGTTEPLTADAVGREFRYFDCLACQEKLYTLGKIADPDVWAKLRADPELHVAGNVAYMVCPRCGAKNGFAEVQTSIGRGFRLTSLID